MLKEKRNRIELEKDGGSGKKKTEKNGARYQEVDGKEKRR